MRAVAIVLSLSICGMATPVVASVMDGKGSPRSYRGEGTREQAFKRLKEKEAGKILVVLTRMSAGETLITRQGAKRGTCTA